MREGTGLESVKDENGKQGGFKCGATVPGRRENTKPGAEMTGSVGEHVTDSSQPSRKGAVRGNITALEAAYEGYRGRRAKVRHSSR